MNVATAFRWRPTALAGRRPDVVRVVDNVVLLANGFECGFSTCWPPASRLVLDRFTEMWTRSAAWPAPIALQAAFAYAQERFTAEAPALITPDADFPDDLPSATLLAVAFEGTTAHLAWIGGEVALLIRDGRLLAATTPHTLRERFAQERPELCGQLDNVPDVLVRMLGPGRDQDLPASTTITAEPGDLLVLASRSRLAPEVLAREVDGRDDLGAMTEWLADRMFATDVAYAAVAAVRL